MVVVLGDSSDDLAVNTVWALDSTLEQVLLGQSGSETQWSVLANCTCDSL